MQTIQNTKPASAVRLCSILAELIKVLWPKAWCFWGGLFVCVISAFYVTFKLLLFINTISLMKLEANCSLKSCLHKVLCPINQIQHSAQSYYPESELNSPYSTHKPKHQAISNDFREPKPSIKPDLNTYSILG